MRPEHINPGGPELDNGAHRNAALAVLFKIAVLDVEPIWADRHAMRRSNWTPGMPCPCDVAVGHGTRIPSS